MVLRVKLEIVPYGDEDKAYEIGRLDIFNMGKKYVTDINTRYGVIDLGTNPGLYDDIAYHKREDGAWKLVETVISQLDIDGP